MAQAPKTWILTGSPETFAATRERGFRLVGMKERRRSQALAIVPGDRIVFSLTRVGRFGASVRVTGDLFERTVSDADAAALLLARMRAAACGAVAA
jgi:hypothetical protein